MKCDTVWIKSFFLFVATFWVMLTRLSSYSNDMASLNKIPPIVQMTPLQAATLQPSHFFIAPNYTLTTNNTDAISGIGTPWSTGALRPTAIPCYNPAPSTDVFFNGQCVLPINRTPVHSDKLPSIPVADGDVLLIDPKNVTNNKRKHAHNSNESPIKIKKESNNNRLCDIRNLNTTSDERDNKISYPVSALIDIPGSLSKGSRTSSVSSSLSTVRFGGSLSQLWAASLSSLTGKLNNMKSTG